MAESKAFLAFLGLDKAGRREGEAEKPSLNSIRDEWVEHTFKQTNCINV